MLVRSIAARALVALWCSTPLALLAQDVPESVRAKQDVLWAQMERSIGDVVRATDAVVGVAVLDLTDQRAYYLNADAVYPTASTIKIAVLGELYGQNERGRGARLDELYVVDAKDFVGGEGVLQTMTPGVTRLTYRDLATLVVSLSDNAATNVLINRVGMENVNAWLARLELKHTRLRRHMMDVDAAREGRENTATPRELVTLLRALHEGRALGKAASEALIGILSLQKMNYVARLLPAELKIANKPGNLDGVRNDAGIIYVADRPFAIAVMVAFARTDLQAEESIARIGHAAWSYFDRVGKSSPLGRVVR